MNIAILLFGVGTIASPSGTERIFVTMANEFAKMGANIYAVWNDNPGLVPYYAFDVHVHQINLELGKMQVPVTYKIMRELAKGLHINAVNRVDTYKTEKLVQAFKKKIDINQLDILICYEFNSVMVANRFSNGKIPVVAMCHNSIEDQIASLTPLQRKEASRVTQYEVLLPSFIPKAKSLLDTKVEAIPNVVPQVPDDLVADLSADKKAYIILSIGRINKHQKRPLLAIKSFLTIASSFPDWQFHLYGPKSDNAYFQEIETYVREHDTGHQVHYMGVTQNSTQILRNGDIFVFPSAYEGFGLSLAEANTAGIPAVGFSYAPAVNELIQDGVTGYLADDAVDFTNKLKMLMLDKTKRVEMGKAAHTRMKAYAPEVIWKQWKDLLVKLTGKNMGE